MMNNQFDEFLEEVQNDIRQEKYHKIWQQYGKTITAGATSILAAVACFMLFENYQHRKQTTLSDQYLSSLNYLAQGKSKEALAMLETMDIGQEKVYGFLRDFQKAELFLMRNDSSLRSQGVALYENMAKNTSLPEIVRGMASLSLIRYFASQKSKTPDALLEMLKPLQDEKNPLRHFAKEYAGEQLYVKGELKAALIMFSDLAKDPHAPEGVKLRAQLMAQVLRQQMDFKPTHPSSENKD